jgi:hypothetical protein
MEATGMESANKFTLPEAARIAGMSYQCIDAWVRAGLFTPSVQPVSVRGNHERYMDFRDLFAVGCAWRLRRAGATAASSAKALSFLTAGAADKMLKRIECRPFLVVNETDAWLLTGQELTQVLELEPRTPAVFSIYHAGKALENLRRLVESRESTKSRREATQAAV